MENRSPIVKQLDKFNEGAFYMNGVDPKTGTLNRD